MLRRILVLFLVTAGSVTYAQIPHKPKVPRATIFAPKPRYPTDENGHRPTGSGVVLMHVDTKTGFVVSAEMEKSTGSKILDDAALEAFRRWRFKPDMPHKEVRAPIKFSHSPNVS
jgi:TonB family protein